MEPTKVKTQRKVCSFDENDITTYSCRRGLGLKQRRLVGTIVPHVLLICRCFGSDNNSEHTDEVETEG